METSCPDNLRSFATKVATRTIALGAAFLAGGALALCLASAQKAEAFDLGCGVNYFGQWCDPSGKPKPQAGAANAKKPPTSKSSDDPYEWAPENTPPVVVDFFKDPTPENAKRYREWHTKRMQRLEQMDALIHKEYGNRTTQDGLLKDMLAVGSSPGAAAPSLPAAQQQKAPAVQPFSKAVYFFKDTCQYCAKMTPLLAAYQNTGMLVGLGIGMSNAASSSYLQGKGVYITAAGDPDGTYAKNYRVASVPTLILMNDKGDIVGRIEGGLEGKQLEMIFSAAKGGN